jgi:predicted RNA binding protein YcfA (HicA-like mRNA interferase family)
VTSPKKILEKILRGTSDANIRFGDLRTLLLALGFEERTRGGHYIFKRDDIDEIVTLQPKGSKAKVYQVKQIRQLILEYKLGSHGKE